MIKVNRASGAPAEIVKLALNEEKRNTKKLKRTFRVYSDPRIKAALEEIFHGKCAYCESRYQATQPMDVEHWRPKSVYWFLAADWANLYPSCIDCNRQRTHKVRLPDGTQQEIVVGKLDQFPLDNNAPVAANRAALAQEQPLLLDPCTDDPETFFTYGEKGVVRPQSANERAEASIRVYALNRMGLVNERYEWQLLIGKHIHRIRQLAKGLEKLDTLSAKRSGDRELEGIIEDLIRYEVCALNAMCEESRPYTAQSRQLVREFFASDDGAPGWLTSR